MRTRSRFGALALLLAAVSWGTPADAAPPLPEPEIPPPPEPAPAPAPAPANPADRTYPTPPGATSSPPANPAKGSSSSPFAPPPNLSKNPIDVLPGDVIYPPLGDKPSSPIRWDPEWARFSTADWIITGTGAAVTLGAAIIRDPLRNRAPARHRVVAEILDVPKRDDSRTIRVGPVVRIVLSRRVEVRGSFVPTVVSPDHIGLIGGDFTELGFRYRWATE